MCVGWPDLSTLLKVVSGLLARLLAAFRVDRTARSAGLAKSMEDEQQ